MSKCHIVGNHMSRLKYVLSKHYIFSVTGANVPNMPNLNMLNNMKDKLPQMPPGMKLDDLKDAFHNMPPTMKDRLADMAKCKYTCIYTDSKKKHCSHVINP